jgi:hypothetical protein
MGFTVKNGEPYHEKMGILMDFGDLPMRMVVLACLNTVSS